MRTICTLIGAFFVIACVTILVAEPTGGAPSARRIAAKALARIGPRSPVVMEAAAIRGVAERPPRETPDRPR